MTKLTTVLTELGAGSPLSAGSTRYRSAGGSMTCRAASTAKAPRFGFLLAADRHDVVVEYALRGITSPPAVSTYTTHRALPEELRRALPSTEDLADVSATPTPGRARVAPGAARKALPRFFAPVWRVSREHHAVLG